MLNSLTSRTLHHAKTWTGLLLQKVAFLQVYCYACLMRGVKVSFPESPPSKTEHFPGRDSTVRLWPISHCSCQRCFTPRLCVTGWISLVQNQTLAFALSCSSTVRKEKIQIGTCMYIPNIKEDYLLLLKIYLKCVLLALTCIMFSFSYLCRRYLQSHERMLAN